VIFVYHRTEDDDLSASTVIARSGRLVKRHVAFQREAMAALEAHGSVLIGAWEVWIGPEAGCGVYQIRQFESLAAWEEHRERVHRDEALNERYRSGLSHNNDFVETAIVKCADGAPPLAREWAQVDAVRGQPRGYFEQRILYFRPGTSAAHHRFYFEHLAPALERDGATLTGFFDTVIGPGTTNTGSHRSVSQRFPTWRVGAAGSRNQTRTMRLVKETWLSKVKRVEAIFHRWTTAVCMNRGNLNTARRATQSANAEPTGRLGCSLALSRRRSSGIQPWSLNSWSLLATTSASRLCARLWEGIRLPSRTSIGIGAASCA
jgi:hypothetical protein